MILLIFATVAVTTTVCGGLGMLIVRLRRVPCQTCGRYPTEIRRDGCWCDPR